MGEVFCLQKNLPSTERFRNLAGLETHWYEVTGLCVAVSVSVSEVRFDLLFENFDH